MSSPRVLRDPPRAAVIGTGFIGAVHAEALRRIGVPVVGLLGSSPGRARPAADRLGIPQVYRDLDELLADDEVESVHITSPNAAHFGQARRVLESGRHVLCEKPLATTPEETAALVALAADRPTQAAAVNYNIRFYPIAHEMRARAARGDIGRLLSVTGSYTQDWLLKPTDWNWRVEPDGGTNLRAVGDIGTHWMDLAQFVAGEPFTAVSADLATFFPERLRPVGQVETFSGSSTGELRPVAVTTEDFGSALLRFPSDARGAFHVSQTFAGRKNRLLLEVAGSEGAMAWDSEDPDVLRIGRRGRPDELLQRDPSLLSPDAAAVSRYPGGHVEGFPDTFASLFLAFYEGIAAGLPLPSAVPTFADGHRELRLCDAIARSARSRIWQTVEPAPAPN